MPPYKPKLSHASCRARRKEIATWVAAHGSDGSAVDRAATEFGMGRTMVLEACKENAVVVLRATNKPLPSTYRIIAALIAGDSRLKEIAAREGISPQRVGQIRHQCIEAGIPIKGKGKKPPSELPRSDSQCIVPLLPNHPERRSK